MAVSCMRNASGHNYRSSSFIVDVAMGQIPRSTERIFSWYTKCYVDINNGIHVQQELLTYRIIRQ